MDQKAGPVGPGVQIVRNPATRTIVQDGTIVEPAGRTPADVLIVGETVAGLVQPGSEAGRMFRAAADVVVDAKGKYVIPGGVDVHTHMEMPFGGTFASDTFETGTKAAAIGGTTTIVDFVVQYPGQSVLEQYSLWRAKAAGNCAIDYGFHQILSDVQDDSLKAMDDLMEEGVTSFKLFMAYKNVFLSDDGQILRAFQRGASNGALMMIHAENGAVIDVLAQQLIDSGKTAPYWHGISRPWQTESEATHRAIAIADIAGAPLYVVHVSAKQAVDQIEAARSRGQLVFGETCPQYLYLSLEEQLGAPGFEGAKWVCSTPLRSRAEGHQDALWQSLKRNALQLVSTDHCPFCISEKERLAEGRFDRIPNGMGTVEHRLDLLYQGVVDGQITLERWVDVACATPARMFGLHGRKGTLQPGADADVVVYDPAGSTVIGLPIDSAGNATGRQHHMNVDYSAWEGFSVKGAVDTVLSRGMIVSRDHQFVGQDGRGQYLRRGVCQYLT